MMEKRERHCFIFIIAILAVCLGVSLFFPYQVDEDNYNNSGTLILTITPVDSIIFGDNIGKLSWENGIFEFEGDVGKSAELFFQYVKFWIEDYIEKGDD